MASAKILPLLIGAFLTAAMVVVVGCSREPDAIVSIRLSHERAPSSSSVSLRAHLEHEEDGITYQWFSVHGQCVPQESFSPETEFKFGRGFASDRVSVAIWQRDRIIAQSYLDVSADDAEIFAKAPPLKIEMIDVPPFDPTGLQETRHHISGKVVGEVIDDLQVIIYCRHGSNDWLIQPNVYDSHPLHSDHSWSTWTHGGTSYAVLVAYADYTAPASTGVLPALGGRVLARTIFEGTREQ